MSFVDNTAFSSPDRQTQTDRHLATASAALAQRRGGKKGRGSPYSTSERRVAEPIPVLCSQPAGDVSHKPGGRLPLFSARPAVTLATLMRAATNFAAG